MLSERPLWISDSDVSAVFGLEDALHTLRRAYAVDPAEVSAMPRSHACSGESILHAVGGVSRLDGVGGTKTWLYSPGGARPLTILYDLDGALVGIVESFRLGQWRTAGTTGLATEVLSQPTADVLAIAGTGRQALMQIAAVAAVRRLRRVQVWGRDRGRLAAFVEEAASKLGIEVIGSTDLASTLADAPIVVTVTRAAEPFFGAGHVSLGAHVNAVGAIVPSRRELGAEAVGLFDVVVADSVEQARNDAEELRAAVDRGVLAWNRVRSLHEVLVDPDAGRRSADQLTLFKALGVGSSDVVLGAAVLRRAQERGLGSALPATFSNDNPIPNSEVLRVKAKHP